MTAFDLIALYIGLLIGFIAGVLTCFIDRVIGPVIDGALDVLTAVQRDKL